MSPQSSHRRLERAGDAELVRLTRRGDTDAYATLFRRHASAAASVARSVTSSYEPDDLVSEAYARILQALQSGNGPTDAFRPYLFTTVRNIAASWGRSGKDAVPLEPEELESLAVQEDHSLVVLDRSLTAQAFRTLPPRWQEALWYSEVEGMQPAELAPILGLSAQSAAALCYRAREGLRQAWIRAHLTSADLEPECAWTVEHLAAHARGRLGKRDRARVDGHLETCEKCTMAAAEAEETGARLALVLLPLILGAGAATIYGATLKGGAVAGTVAGAAGVGAGAATSSGAGGGAAGTGAASGGFSAVFSGATGVIVGTAASMVIVGGAVAGVLIATSPGRGTDASPAVVGGTTGSSRADPPAPSQPVPVPPAGSPADAAAPAASPDDVEPSAPVAGSTTPGPATPDPGRGGAPGTTPTGPGDPTGPTNPQPPAPPTIGSVDTGGGLYFPIVTGTAVPGATISIAADGATATTTADATGAWSAAPFAGQDDGSAAPAEGVSRSAPAMLAVPATDGASDSSAAPDTSAAPTPDVTPTPAPTDAPTPITAPTDAPPVTFSGTITATQSVDGVPSQQTSASFTITGPGLSAQGWLWEQSPVVSVHVTSAQGAATQILIDGAPAEPIFSLDGDGLFLLTPGQHDIAARYTDASGRFGPSTHLRVTIDPWL